MMSANNRPGGGQGDVPRCHCRCCLIATMFWFHHPFALCLQQPLQLLVVFIVPLSSSVSCKCCRHLPCPPPPAQENADPRLHDLFEEGNIRQQWWPGVSPRLWAVVIVSQALRMTCVDPPLSPLAYCWHWRRNSCHIQHPLKVGIL
jgi:hypothetical protein